LILRYIVKVDSQNPNMPGNLYLLLGDETLELTMKSVETMRDKSSFGDHTPWMDGTTLIKRMIAKYARKLKKAEGVERLTVFIDTNPAFSVYTELAIAASNRLIIPLNADDFSRSAANAMLANIYGTQFNPSYDDACFRMHKKAVFSSRAKKEGLELPKIHLAINNRVAQYGTRSSKTFKAMGDTVVKTMYAAYQKRADIFMKPEHPILDQDQFRRAFFFELKDFHKTAIQSIHLGMPLSVLMNENNLQIAEEKGQVDKKVVSSCLDWVKVIVNKL